MENKYDGATSRDIIAIGMFIIGCVMIANGVTKLLKVAGDKIYDKITRKRIKTKEA